MIYTNIVKNIVKLLHVADKEGEIAVEALVSYLERGKEELTELCNKLGINKREVLNLSYETLAVQKTVVKKADPGGHERIYEYIQLKGFRKKKAYTVGTWKPDDPEVLLLEELVILYRGLRFLTKAIEYLNHYERKRPPG